MLVEFLAPRYATGHLDITVDDARRFLAKAPAERFAKGRWGESVTTRVAQGLLATLRDQILPPTINLDDQDPECDLDYVPNHTRKAEVEYALSNSFGFGGTNGSLLFKRWTA